MDQPIDSQVAGTALAPPRDLKHQLLKIKEENAVLSLEVAQLQQRVHEQASIIRRLRNLRAVKWTKPFQRISHWWEQRVQSRTPADLIPYHHIMGSRKKGQDIWISTGDDPQFLIQPVYKEMTREAGWFMLEYEFQCTHNSSQQLFFDLGEGFVSAMSLTWEAPASGRISLPIYLPSGWHALRLDPLTHEATFHMDHVFLRRLSKRPDHLAPHNSSTYDYLEHHKSGTKVLGRLSPIQQLAKVGNNPLHWQSVGEDPYFIWELNDTSELQSGWHAWQFKLHTTDDSSRSTMSRLYLDSGDGFNEVETVNLPLNHSDDAPSSRVFFSKKNITRIRFDPIDYPGEFRIETLGMETIHADESLHIMLDHLSLHHPNHLEKSKDSILHSIQPLCDASGASPLEVVSRLYEETQVNNNTLIDYKAWMNSVEPSTIPSNQAIEQSIRLFAHPPLISVVMPTYNTPEKYLRLCIESIIKQSYPHWELCIADDNSPQTHVQRILKEYAQRDPRIKYTIREVNGHISAASNSALALATGNFVALLDHDDELPSYALYFIAEAINAHPDAAVIYSDEDKIDEAGSRFEPHFKSDWNPDLFLSQNYVSHLGVYRRTLLEQISGFRLGVEGSQDQDLLLRCLPHINATQIIHVPRILYHWRTLPGSTAMAAGEKTYTTDAGIKALEDYFQQTGQQVRVEMGKVPNTYRTHYPIPTPEPLVSLLIPTRDKVELVETAVRSILEKSTYQNYEILILDNGSIEDATLSYFIAIQAQDSRVRVLRWDFPFNYSAINNFGASQAKGEILGLINNDIEVISPEWLSEMVSHAIRPEIGCVGAKLYYPDETLQHAGVLLGVGGVANHAHLRSPRSSLGPFARLTSVQNFSAVTAAVLLVKKRTFNQVNGLNEKDLTIAFNDVDFCLRVRQLGLRNIWTPYAELYHYESISRGSEDNPEKLARFNAEVEYMQTTWGPLLEQDPMYNPNLNRSKPDYSIASDALQ
ncbi:glycosyltransferase family 2 protein [Ephemeroptericola cinctiostellae]|nr:glycosyltransferase [Ephemeroptericola cinctiostellae]